MGNKVLLSTDFKDLKLFRRGKVRDVYDLGDKLLIISTDRISCFDVILPDGIPNKGRVLTGISCFWFKFLEGIARHHLLTSDIEKYPVELKKYRVELEGRSMLVKKTKPLPMECIVRGYLSGSGWKEYKESGSVCGIKLPAGLKESQKLPQPVFTPSTKADAGHDININADTAKALVSEEIFEKIKSASIAIYKKAADYAASQGIIIADTKFEFGRYDEEIILIDEVLTPDSSRFWPQDTYKIGGSNISFDKQFVRDYLEGIAWDKNPPAPKLPDGIIMKTCEKYLEAYKRITSRELIN